MAGDPVAFQNIPGTGLTAPFIGFEFNAGVSYITTARMVLMGYTTSAGTLAMNTLSPCASQAQADEFCGPGSMLREMYRVAQAMAPALPIWLLPVADPGTSKATWTGTVSTSPAPAPGAGYFEVSGVPIQIAVLPTDTSTTIAANIAAAINGYYDSLTGRMLPVTATSASNVVTITARHAGAIMNDVDLYVNPYSYNVFTGTLTFATGTAGTGLPTVSTALAAIGQEPCDFLVAPFDDTTTLSSVASAFGDVNGRWAWMNLSYGAYWFPKSGSFSALITAGLAFSNVRQFVPIGRPGGISGGTPTPSWIWVAERAAREAPWLSDIVTGRVSCNQTGRRLLESRPTRDPTIRWNYNARNQLLQANISTIGVTPDGAVAVDKTVTAWHLNPISNAPDTTFQGVQSIYQIGFGFPYIRAVVAVEQGNKALAPANPGSLQSIATPDDIKGSFVGALRTLENQGVFNSVSWTALNMIVAINPQNPSRADVYLPIVENQPLDIIATNAMVYRMQPNS